MIFYLGVEKAGTDVNTWVHEAARLTSAATPADYLAGSIASETILPTGNMDL